MQSQLWEFEAVDAVFVDVNVCQIHFILYLHSLQKLHRLFQSTFRILQKVLVWRFLGLLALQNVVDRDLKEPVFRGLLRLKSTEFNFRLFINYSKNIKRFSYILFCALFLTLVPTIVQLLPAVPHYCYQLFVNSCEVSK